MAAGALALKRHKGAVQPPRFVWEQEWVNYFQHTSAEITKVDYHSAGGSIVDATVDGPPGFTEYNTISICDDGTTFSNLYNPGSGNIAIPPVGNLMMSWYMKREDGGVCSVGLNASTGSCYTRIFSAASPAGQVGAEAVGDGWYRGWCTAYGLTTGSMINTGLLRASTQYANDGNSKLYVTCFQLEPIVPGVVDETTGPSPFRPTTDYTIGERKRLRSTTAWTPTAPMTQIGKYAFLQSNSYWVDSFITRTRDTTEPSPITGIPTYKLVESVTVNGRHSIASTTDISVVEGVQYKFVGIGKYDGDRTHMLLGTGAAGFPNNSGKFFDLQNGAVSNDFGAFPATDYGEIEDLGRGWYKCIMYFTADAGGTTNFIISNGDGPDANYNGDGASGILFAGGYVQKAGEPDLLDTMGYKALNVSNSPTIHSANNVIYMFKGAVQSTKLSLARRVKLVRSNAFNIARNIARALTNG